ncbi:MAG: helix-turn-helix domain-containing protein [Actinobacteria bacterium]|nr:helix-turn-helix domain-containing protein [Actinomycetota bacterium]
MILTSVRATVPGGRNGLSQFRPYRYGGTKKLTQADWAAIAASRAAQAADPLPHGTDRGYQRHRSLGQDPCDPCRDAHNAKNAATRARAGTGPQPGLQEQARKARNVITSRPAAQAARELGVSRRTVVRWLAVLREGGDS